jgi:hypothetical protein
MHVLDRDEERDLTEDKSNLASEGASFISV